MVRVGRWMSRTELRRMRETGSVQGDYVILPPARGGFAAALPGSVYVEFDIGREALAQGGREDWFIVIRPTTLRGRRLLRTGGSMPDLRVHDVRLVGWKQR